MTSFDIGITEEEGIPDVEEEEEEEEVIHETMFTFDAFESVCPFVRSRALAHWFFRNSPNQKSHIRSSYI